MDDDELAGAFDARSPSGIRRPIRAGAGSPKRRARRTRRKTLRETPRTPRRARAPSGREARSPAPPLDDETRARLADTAPRRQLREPRGGAARAVSAGASSGRSGSRGSASRCPEEWDCDAEEASDVADAAPLERGRRLAQRDERAVHHGRAGLSRAIDGESVPPRYIRSRRVMRRPRGAARPGGPCPARAGRRGRSRRGRRARALPRPELVVERRSARRTTSGGAGPGGSGCGRLGSCRRRSGRCSRYGPRRSRPGAAPLPTTRSRRRSSATASQQARSRAGHPTPRRQGKGSRSRSAGAGHARAGAGRGKGLSGAGGTQERAPGWSMELALDGVGGASISGTREEELFRDVAGGIPGEVVLVAGPPRQAKPGPDDPLPTRTPSTWRAAGSGVAAIVP